MKLYICWGTGGSDHHDCHKAHQALIDARHEFDVVKARGQEHLPKLLQFKVRQEVFALTGSYFVPVLVLDDGTAINKPDEIVAWASAHRRDAPPGVDPGEER
jgi:glutaredoxin